MSVGDGFRIELAKGDFKFSAAHFTILGERAAEPLHGHNYTVSVTLEGRQLDPLGFLLEFGAAKQVVRELCAELDERFLLPARNPYLRGSFDADPVVLIFADRRYQLPRSDVVVLPIENTTSEALAHYLWGRLMQHFTDPRLDRLTVCVEETPGQRAGYQAQLPRPKAARTGRSDEVLVEQRPLEKRRV
jgi:6-pyruvoyltetrahydropterin/6-carboxytetrahydropterin synthase